MWSCAAAYVLFHQVLYPAVQSVCQTYNIIDTCFVDILLTLLVILDRFERDITDGGEFTLTEAQPGAVCLETREAGTVIPELLHAVDELQDIHFMVFRIH